MARLEGLVAIVTGGGQGFGAGIVERFLAEGASVVTFDLQKVSTKEVERCIYFQGDVTKESDWREAVSCNSTLRVGRQGLKRYFHDMAGRSSTQSVSEATHHRGQQCRLHLQSKAVIGSD